MAQPQSLAEGIASTDPTGIATSEEVAPTVNTTGLAGVGFDDDPGTVSEHPKGLIPKGIHFNPVLRGALRVGAPRRGKAIYRRRAPYKRRYSRSYRRSRYSSRRY